MKHGSLLSRRLRISGVGRTGNEKKFQFGKHAALDGGNLGLHAVACIRNRCRPLREWDNCCGQQKTVLIESHTLLAKGGDVNAGGQHRHHGHGLPGPETSKP